jgi:hypothetical protein
MQSQKAKKWSQLALLQKISILVGSILQFYALLYILISLFRFILDPQDYSTLRYTPAGKFIAAISPIKIYHLSSFALPIFGIILSGFGFWLQSFNKVKTIKAVKRPPTQIDLDLQVKKLAELYDRSPGGQGFIVNSSDSEPVHEIGEEINAAGGFALMREAHDKFARLHPGAARNLEMVWHGIGTWLG